MANDIPISTPPSPTEKVAARDIGVDGGGLRRKAQQVDSAPWPRTPVAATLANSKKTFTGVEDLGSSKPSGATHCEISVNGNCRWWDDGKTPTASEGKPLYAIAASPTYFWVEAPDDFKIIPETGTVEMNISWYQYTIPV